MAKSIFRLFNLAGKYKSKMILSVILATASVGFGIIPLFIIYNIIVDAIDGKTDFQSISILAIIAGGLLVLKVIAFSIATVLSHKAAYRILYNMRIKLAKKFSDLPLGYLTSRASGTLKKVMVEDVERLEQFLAHNIPETISSIAVPFFVTIYMFFLDWRMTLALLSTIPLAYVFFIRMMKGYKVKMEEYTRATEKMNGTIVEYVKGMAVIKAFNQTTKSFSKYSESLENYKTYTMEWFKYCWPYMAAYLVVLSANSIVIIPVGAYFYFKGSLDLAAYILFMLISLGFAAPILKFTEFLDGIVLICSAEQSINDILNEDELYRGTEMILPASYDIKFKDVKFSYDKKDVLNGISFEAKQGETTALVGPSGSGKSTIAKLIARFWDVSSGKITIGNINIKDIPIKELMELVSFVFQDVFLFNDTILENIRMGKKDASDEEVIQAAKRAMCHDFILKTENGYNTIVGSDGSKLSGGERQRISIARAILRNSPIVILDEATAYTDPENEDKIQQSINSLTKGKTLIIIAHRLSTIMHSNKIIVINEGNIESQGTHDELLSQSLQYKNMWKAHIDAANWQFDLKGGTN